MCIRDRSNNTAKNVAYAIIPTEINSKYTIGKYYENGIFISSLNIPIPGLHNLSNITAAIAASRMIGVDFIEIKKNIKLTLELSITLILIIAITFLIQVKSYLVLKVLLQTLKNYYLILIVKSQGRILMLAINGQTLQLIT